MSACCDVSETKPPLESGVITIALAGNPNSGKTTIFNALTGLRQKVGNYPGITVDRKVGRCRLPDNTDVQIIDLPGTYSLVSRSPDEIVAMEVLRGLRSDTPLPERVVVVVDASNLQRNLYLVSQLIELGRPMVIALNMMDVAARRGIAVSCEDLERLIGVPVVPLVGHKKEGIEQLKAAILKARVALMPEWPLPLDMQEEIALVGGGLAILDSSQGLECEAAGLKRATPAETARPNRERLDRYHAIAERLLIGDRAGDLTTIAAREPVVSMLSSAESRMHQSGIDPMQADIEAHYAWIEKVAHGSVHNVEEEAAAGNDGGVPAEPRVTMSERVDSILIHRFWGLLIFAAIMGSLFVSIFWLAQPIMDAITDGIAWLGNLVTGGMAEGPLKALISDGMFQGVGAVVVFVPQIALLFLFLSILEDSGYLARAAFLMDRLLSRVGLHGKSFIPLLSSFACAIPGIMATRTIESRKDRLATILVAPFMSCSARLPVYTLLIGVFFASHGALFKAGIMLSLYALGIVAAASCAWLFKRSILRGPTPAFILELPTYKFPQASQVARQVWTNSSEFLRRAGTVIFCMSVILWAMTYYPRLPEAKRQEIQQVATAAGLDEHAADNRASAAQREYSIAGRLGHGMEPAIRPLGYDWKIGVGLIGAFAAREVFVSTVAITYAADDPDGAGPSGLAEAMRNDTYQASYGAMAGQPIWTPLIACSVLVWFVLAMQCMSTMAVVRRETGSWRWPLFMLVYMNAMAYVICLMIYQVGSRL
jgi:ferrous iron transport protein B